MRIIGFAGRKRSGKGELSNVISNDFNGQILTIANYLKFLCCDLLNVTLDELNTMKDDGTVFGYKPYKRWYNIISKRTGLDTKLIEENIGYIEFTNVRQMLQVIGTDLIRKYIPNWHVEQLVKSIKSFSDDKIIAIDDVRFPNERKAIEDLGGEVFFIMRPNFNEVSNHISETSLKWQDFKPSNVIINNTDLETFRGIFKLKFINNFEINLTNSIFLSDNLELIEDFNNFVNENNSSNPLVIESLKIYR